MSDEITFNDCCRMILEQGPPARQPAPPDKPDYRRDLLFLLNKEFGLEWKDTDGFQPSVGDDDGVSSRVGVPIIATTLVRCYGGLVDPFSGWLEYPPVKGEMAVLRAHRPGIGDAVLALRERFVALFHNLLLLRWPEAARRTTSWAKLQALGLVVPVYDPDNP
jgi:hypothetical protein